MLVFFYLSQRNFLKLNILMDSEETNIKDLLKKAKSLILSDSDLPSGVKLLKKVIKQDPENYWAYIYYGFAAKKKSSDKEALQSFEKATKLSPDSFDGWKGILSCLNPNNQDDPVFVNAYRNLLRLENDEIKWNALLEKAKAISSNFITLLDLCIEEDFLSANFKHKIACKLVTESIFKSDHVVDCNYKVVLYAFKGYATTRDVFDRAEFCQKAIDYFIQIKYFEGLFDFFYFTLLQYDTKPYPVWFLSKVIVEIALHDISKVEELLPFIENVFSEASTLPMAKRAFCIVLFCKKDYLGVMEILEPLSYLGDTFSSLLLLKCLIKLMDYDTVLYLVTCLSRPFFEQNTDFILQIGFIECLVEALARSNDSLFLKLAVKLGMKALEKSSDNRHVLFSLCHACLGLRDRKFIYYLNKLEKSSPSVDIEYLKTLWMNESSKHKSCKADSIFQIMHSVMLNLLNGNFKNAVREYGRALRLSDKCFNFHTVLGINYEAVRDTDKALNCYDTVLSLRSHDSSAIRLLCDLLLRNNNVEDAINILENCCSGLFVKWHSTAEKVSSAAGAIRFIRSEYQKALQNYSHALKLNPGSTEYLEMIAEMYLCMNKFLSAENIYMKILSSDANNLHIMLSRAFTFKLNVTHASYYNNSIYCINSVLSAEDCLHDYENIVKLLFNNFIQIYASKYSSSVDSVINASFSKYLNKLLIMKSNNENSLLCKANSQEYLIALYFFLEAHFIAAVKYEKRREFNLAHELYQFCVNGICRALEVYGSSHVAFWKLLGDVLLKSSSQNINSSIEIPARLISDPSQKKSKASLVSSSGQINLAIKCFTVCLKLVDQKTPDRISEFYYDIAVSFLSLANHPDVVSTKLRYYYLKHALRSAGEAFVSYNGSIANIWIIFNLIGVITSVMGSGHNFFKGFFSSFSMDLREDFLINNRASFYLKEASFPEAQELYELGKLQGDTDYSSPWVGHLLTLLLIGDCEVKLKLQFLLKLQGNHKLLRWLYAVNLYQKQGQILDNGERATLQRVFKDFQCENNVSRLTMLGYIKEVMGDMGSARRAYIKALRLAKYNIDEKTYDILLQNVVRISGRCNLSCDLLQHFNFEERKTSFLTYLRLSHINGITFDRKRFQTLSSDIVESFDKSYSQCDQVLGSVLSVILRGRPSSALKESDLFEVSNVSEIMCKNVQIFLKFPKHLVKKIITSESVEKQEVLLRALEYLYHSRQESSARVIWLEPENSVYREIDFTEWNTFTISKKSDIPSGYSLICCKPSSEDKVVDVLPPLDKAKSDQTLQTFRGHPYAVVLRELRDSMFPLPPSIQERFVRREQKVIDNQLNEKRKRLKVKSMRHHVSPLLVPSLRFDQSITETTCFWGYETHGCHRSCTSVVNQLFYVMKCKRYNTAAKYLRLCLDVMCRRCFNIKELIPLIAFLSTYLKNHFLLQKAIHLYPDEKLLWKAFTLFSQK